MRKLFKDIGTALLLMVLASIISRWLDTTSFSAWSSTPHWLGGVVWGYMFNERRKRENRRSG